MDKRTSGRDRRKTTGGLGVHRREDSGSAGTGPVNNTGNYEARQEQEEARKAASSQQRPVQSRPSAVQQRPAQQRPSAAQPRPAQQRPGRQQATGNGNNRGALGDLMGMLGGQQSSGSSQQSSNPLGGLGSLMGMLGGSNQQSGTSAGQTQQTQNPQTHTPRPPVQQSTVQHTSAPQQSSSQQSSGTGKSGCSSKLILIVIAVIAVILIVKFMGGNNDSNTQLPVSNGTQTTTSGSLFGDTDYYTSGQNTTGTSNSTYTDFQSENTGSTVGSSMGLGDLLSAFMGGGYSDYDFGGTTGSGTDYYSSYGMPDLSSMFGSYSTSGQLNSSVNGNSSSTAVNYGSGGDADTTVASGARKKYTTIKGKQKDIVTIMVYMCGTDLESEAGMGTSDIKEMLNAKFGDNVNLLIYTGGCKRWKNNVVSSSVNQIYQVKDGQLLRLEENAGTASMVKPATLTSFINYCASNFPANRNMLIFWDHGGGSISGYGYDEKNPNAGSMTLDGINTALKNAGIKFDVIGYDACLMATVENGLMLSQYADYMIASEEAEPGVGWYYTNWLTKLGSNTSMKTVALGKIIVDDFVDVCNQQCRGQATTLSITDLAEMEATIPDALTDFSLATNTMIQDQYSSVSRARNSTREFAQSSRIDQIDLTHFAMNLGTQEGKALAQALDGAVKYNRFSGSMSNAYGLSIYFPYKQASNVSKAVKTYKAIGMNTEYTRCIQEFASMEVSGQAVSGGSSSYSSLFGNYGSSYGSSYGNSYGSSYNSYGSSYGGSSYGSSSYGSSILGSLLGGGNDYSGSYGGGMSDILGGLFGGSSSSSGGLLDFFGGRTLTADKAAAYIKDNHLDATKLVWTKDKDGYGLTLSDEQWSQVSNLLLNVFYDVGDGFFDLGTDFVFTRDGNTLRGEYDRYWLSINKQPVAYYFMNCITTEAGDIITGYVPVKLNGIRANLIIISDPDHPDGYIAGAQTVYANGETETVAKNLINVGKGDKLDFLADYYSYKNEYLETQYLGEPMVLGDNVEISYTYVGDDPVQATYCFYDLYQNQYWTPVIP